MTEQINQEGNDTNAIGNPQDLGRTGEELTAMVQRVQERRDEGDDNNETPGNNPNTGTPLAGDPTIENNNTPENQEETPEPEAEDNEEVNDATPEEARAAIPALRNRISMLEERLRVLPREHSGRFNQEEAQVLSGYVSEFRRKLNDPNNVLGGKKFRERQIEGLDTSRFRTPDAARGFMIDLIRKGGSLEKAQQRLDLRKSQKEALGNLRTELEFHRDRRNISRALDEIQGRPAGEQLHPSAAVNGRTRQEWDSFIEAEQSRLQKFINEGQLTPAELDNYVAMRKLQRDSLATTREDGSVRPASELTNPFDIPNYNTYNQGDLYLRVQELISDNPELNLSQRDIEALINLYPENASLMANRVTKLPENTFLSNLLQRTSKAIVIEGERGESRINILTLQDGVNLDQALGEFSGIESALSRGIADAEQKLEAAKLDFDQLAGEIELTANPNARQDIESEIADLEGLIEEYEAIVEGRTPEPTDDDETPADPATTETDAERERRERNERWQKRLLKGVRILAGAALGGISVISLGAPAGAIMAVAGGVKLAGMGVKWFAGVRKGDWSDNDSPAVKNYRERMAAQGLSNEEINQKIETKIKRWSIASKLAEWTQDVALGTVIGAGIGGLITGNWVAGGTGTEKAMSANQPMDGVTAGGGRISEAAMENTLSHGTNHLDLSQLTDSAWARTNVDYIPTPSGGLPEISSQFSGGSHGMLVNQFLDEASKHGITNINQLGPNPNAAFDRIMSNMLNGMSFDDAWMAVFNTAP